MRTNLRRVLSAALCAVTALGAAACATDGSSDIENGVSGGGRRTAGGSDIEGTVLLETVKITKIDRSTMNDDGRVRYTVENVSGADQEDLSWSVSYVFPKGADDSMEISVASVEETTSEKSLVLLRGERDKHLDAVCGAFGDRRARGQRITGTYLNIATNLPVLTTPRDAAKGMAGTRLANGRIECVGISGLYDAGDQLTLEFENVSASKVADLELQVVFTEARDKSKARSKWRVIPSMAPGARAKAVVDLSGLDMGDRSFLVKVKERSL